MNKKIAAAMSLMVLSAVSIAPASANWFSNPRAGVNLNVGSAPNPTPGDLRAIGDSRYQPQRLSRAYPNDFVEPRLAELEGRTLYGANGERLGYVLAVDQRDRMIQVQTPGGVSVAMPAYMVVDRGSRVVAPTVSSVDMRDMAMSQTGHTVALSLYGNDLG